MSNRDNFPADEVAQAIQSSRKDEAVTNPNTRLDILRLFS